MDELKKLAPAAPVLPPVPELALFLALLKRAGVFISGDTGPLHFAAGLGVPTIALFGPSFAGAVGADRRASSRSDRESVSLRSRQWAFAKARIIAWRRFRRNRFWPACKTF